MPAAFVYTPSEAPVLMLGSTGIPGHIFATILSSGSNTSLRGARRHVAVAVGSVIHEDVSVLAELDFYFGIVHRFFEREANFFESVAGLDAAIDVRLRHLRKGVVGMTSAEAGGDAGGVQSRVVDRDLSTAARQRPCREESSASPPGRPRVGSSPS